MLLKLLNFTRSRGGARRKIFGYQLRGIQYAFYFNDDGDDKVSFLVLKNHPYLIAKMLREATVYLPFKK